MVRHDIEADDLEKFEANTPEDPAPRAVDPHAVIEATVAAVAIQTSLTTAPSSGKRQSFRNIARQLDEKELCHPGTVKLIVENLEHADAECDDLRTFVERFHDADKTSAVLQEKLKTEKAVEIAFGAGVGIGCSMISIGICVWEKRIPWRTALYIRCNLRLSIYGDFHGLPPAILTTGTRDLFLSDTVRTHRKLRRAGVEADLQIYEGLSHSQYLFDPSGTVPKEVFGEITRFFDAHLAK